METTLEKVLKVFKTPVPELFGRKHDAIADLTETCKTVLDLGIALGLGALASPIAPIVSAGLPFVWISTRLLKRFHDKREQDRTLGDCVKIASTLAYLKSLEKLLEKTDFWTPLSVKNVSETLQQQAENLENFQLTEDQAEEVIVCFHESELAKAFNQLLSNNLQQAGINQNEAEIVTERVSRNTHRYLNQSLAEAGNAVKTLAQLYRDGWRKELEKYESIEEYLQEIAAKPKEKVFAEEFTFRDIYVPLKAKPVDQKGDVDKKAAAFDLESWAKGILNTSQNQDNVMFIQGGPGRGKSVFCRMFADWVRQNLHPIWTPVLILLRDIPQLQSSFRQTLREAVKPDFAASDDGWLTDRNTRYLFLLDGFDELLMQGRTSGGLEEFMSEVGQFQLDCQQCKDMGHRVLITGRALALHSIEPDMPHNLERVEIQPMDYQLQQQWFTKWSAQFGEGTTSAFQQFLQDSRCPDRVRELAEEPLLLYLLAAMHIDGELTVEMFEGASSIRAKILIYQKSLQWVLIKQRPKTLNRQLTKMETDGLARILSEAALCVVQSGGECAALQMVEERIQDNGNAATLIQQARERWGDDALKNALAAFYLQPTAGDKGGSVEFAHKSFSEFLFAQRLKESLEEWTEPGRKGEEFIVKNDQMAWKIYDLLGYGGLTPEIVEYLMELLTANQQFQALQLFKRLENFYLRWCDGEFIDIPVDIPEGTLPQKKTRQLQKQGIQLGQRQVDVYAGLNVMILLLELNPTFRTHNCHTSAKGDGRVQMN
ncbi:NACHT domain-containing protein [Microcoleus sp. FACHB-831]|uniref:NACHT domain-containing protein n=1 Tax=Microcoleus sp. FACHB-831 TaxID=2692827 RepID=UPI0016885F25|nr:NACHT domain-containing protein [Microcoleus sp. FACHB-831]MBD1921820.1 NACHT domain-containing protein [Microcoleus sp. FACHB-831]